MGWILGKARANDSSGKAAAEAAATAAGKAAENAATERQKSEQQLDDERVTIFRKLNRMRQENHFADAIVATIRHHVSAEGTK